MYDHFNICESTTDNLVTNARTLRRPQTDDPKDFWYISADVWNVLTRKMDSRVEGRLASYKLNKFNAAGRIMETDEGVPATVSCAKCTSLGLECRVYLKVGRGTACGHCRKSCKPYCKASLQEHGAHGAIDMSHNKASARTDDGLMMRPMQHRKMLLNLARAKPTTDSTTIYPRRSMTTTAMTPTQGCKMSLSLIFSTLWLDHKGN
jgi:hypothetical protein